MRSYRFRNPLNISSQNTNIPAVLQDKATLQRILMFQKSKCWLSSSLLLICLSSQAATATDNRAAAIMDNQIITHQQVIDPIESQLYEAEQKVYELKLNQLKSMLLTRLIEAHPFSKGITADAFLKKYVVKNPQVSPQEVELFIKQNKIPAEKINNELKEKVNNYILQEKERRAVAAWFAQQSKEHGVVINLPKPIRPRVEIPIDNAPTLGNKDAKVTIVEYSDFQCPYCAKAEETVKELQKNYADKIKIVYKQYPLGFHKDAFKAAEASLCAHEQSNDSFWKLHDYMLANPRKLSTTNLKNISQDFGINKAQFSQCLDSGKYTDRVNQDIAEGNRFGVQATPMFFVNGIVVRGAQPYQVFAKIIDEELAE